MRQVAHPDFDGDQVAAACSGPHRPLLVLAGPGSGKTAALVARTAHLHDTRRAMASASRAIVALTFTRNAARELVDRLSAQLGADIDRSVIDVRTVSAQKRWDGERGWPALRRPPAPAHAK